MSSLAELDHAIASCDPRRRDEKLARLTNAFLEIAPRLSEAHVTLFDHVMLGLGRVAGEDARAALAHAITPLPNAPLETTRRLALDEVARVAAPILKLSTRVSLDALIEVATQRGSEHLLALAARAMVDPSWAEPLAQRADQAVLCVLAANPSAICFPSIASRIASGGLAAANASSEGRLNGHAAPATSAAGREAAILAAAEAGCWDQVAAHLSAIAGAHPEPFSVAVHSPEVDPMLICMRAADLDWNVARPVIASRFGAAATPRLIADAAATYARLTRDAANRAMQVLVICAKMHEPRAA
jgi:uncharacterized protein (DUF2336 family)